MEEMRTNCNDITGVDFHRTTQTENVIEAGFSIRGAPCLQPYPPDGIGPLPSSENELREILHCAILGVLSRKFMHKVNNLSTGIVGLTTLAKRFSSNSEKVESYLERALQCCLDSQTLMNTILTLSENGAFIKKNSDAFCFIADIISICHTLFQPDCTVRLQTDPSLPVFEVPDPGLKEVILFLLVVALDRITTTQKEVVVHITPAKQNSTQKNKAYQQNILISIEVQPIESEAPEDQSKTCSLSLRCGMNSFLYDLALQSSQALVHNWGGELILSNTNGKSVIASMQVPLQRLQWPLPLVSLRDAKLDPYQPVQHPETLKILLFDYQPRICDFIQTILEEVGHQTLLFRNIIELEQSLATLDLQDIDVFLLDIFGLMITELKVAIRIRERKPDARLIFHSTLNNEETVNEYFPLDHKTRFLRKPFAKEELLETIRDIVKGNNGK